MKVKFDGTLTLNFSGLEVDADNRQEAEEKLSKMDALDIVRKSEIKDLETVIKSFEETHSTTIVRVMGIEFEPNPDLSEEDFAKLPEEVTLVIEDVVYVGGVIADKLFELFKCKPIDYTARIIAKY